MLVDLAAEYRDARAEELGWSVVVGPLRALARTTLAMPPFRVELRLLGASHQAAVWLTGPGRGSLLCRETVACLPGQTVPLPRAAGRELPGWRYSIESSVRAVSRPDFSARLAGIERRAAQGLAGRYPGAPGALTAISVRLCADGLRWVTWHTYPEQGKIAATISYLRRYRAHGGAGGEIAEG